MKAVETLIGLHQHSVTLASQNNNSELFVGNATSIGLWICDTMLAPQNVLLRSTVLIILQVTIHFGYIGFIYILPKFFCEDKNKTANHLILLMASRIPFLTT